MKNVFPWAKIVVTGGLEGKLMTCRLLTTWIRHVQPYCLLWFQKYVTMVLGTFSCITKAVPLYSTDSKVGFQNFCIIAPIISFKSKYYSFKSLLHSILVSDLPFNLEFFIYRRWCHRNIDFFPFNSIPPVLIQCFVINTSYVDEPQSPRNVYI